MINQNLSLDGFVLPGKGLIQAIIGVLGLREMQKFDMSF